MDKRLRRRRRRYALKGWWNEVSPRSRWWIWRVDRWRKRQKTSAGRGPDAGGGGTAGSANLDDRS